MKHFTHVKSLMLFLGFLLLGTSASWGEEVTETKVVYTIASKTEVTETGTAPEGSSATYTQTYTTEKCQITKGNSATLTLTGYAGCTIKGITLNMKSNSSKGTGTFSAVAGTTTLAAISTATTFNKWYDNTSYTSSYKDVNVTMDNDNYVVADNEDIVITISATVNSLYINSYTISYTYDNSSKATTPTISPANGAEFSTEKQEVTITGAEGATIYYTTNGDTPDNTQTKYTGAFDISETTTVKAIAYETGKEASAVATATITYVPLYDITCNKPEGGTYTLKVGDGEAQTISDATTLKAGATKTVTLTSTAADGYKLASTPFSVEDADGGKVSVSKSGTNYSFTMPEKAVSITANYSALYTITVATGIEHGKISFTDNDGNAITETSKGSKVKVVATPDAGYELATLYYTKDGDDTQNNIEGNAFTMVAANVIVYATFTKANYTITYDNNLTGGTISGVTSAQIGDEITLTATPAENYMFKTWSVKNGDSDIEVTDNKFIMPAANVTVSATFTTIAVITLSENGEEHNLSGTYYIGDEITLPETTATTVPAGKTFMGWSKETVATTNTKPTYYEKGTKYTITEASETLYALYASDIKSTYDIVFNVGDEAEARDWKNTTVYTLVEKDPLTFTVTQESNKNSGRFYESDNTWRFYNGGSMSISVSNGTTINGVSTTPTSTFTKDSEGNYSCSYTTRVEYKSLTINVTGPVTIAYETSVATSATLKVSSALYATYYNSEKAYTLPDDCEGYVVNVTNGKLKLDRVYEAGKVVPAGEPLVIYSIEKGDKTLQFTTSTEDSYKSAELNDLEGTDEETALTADVSCYFYALTLDQNNENIGFYWMEDEGAAFTNGAHKAYLKVKKENANDVKGFALDADNATAIEKLTESIPAESIIYNLAGQRVSKARKGVYIRNGRKFITK